MAKTGFKIYSNLQQYNQVTGEVVKVVPNHPDHPNYDDTRIEDLTLCPIGSPGTFTVSSFTQENWKTTDPKTGTTANYKSTRFEVTGSDEPLALGVYVYMGSKIELDSYINDSLEINLSDAVLFENIISFSSATSGTRFCKIDPSSTRAVQDLVLKYYDIVNVSIDDTIDSVTGSDNYTFIYI